MSTQHQKPDNSDERLQEIASRKVTFDKESQNFLIKVDKLEKQLDLTVKGFIDELRGYHNSTCESFDQEFEYAEMQVTQLQRLSDHVQNILSLMTEFREKTTNFY
jgi:hypothetical protein